MMTQERFPFEQSEWRSDESERWLQALDRMGPENVRMILAQFDQTGSGGSIGVGSAHMTKGFAQEWLAWHDQKKTERETTFRASQIYWTRWAALAATLAATAGVIGWIVTILSKR